MHGDCYDVAAKGLRSGRREEKEQRGMGKVGRCC